MSELAEICDSLAKATYKPKDFDSLLTQFINSVQLDPLTLSHFEIDPYFSRLISYFYMAIERSKIPRSCSGHTYAKTKRFIEFLINISALNPSLHQVIATEAHLDVLIIKLFKESVLDKNSKNAHKPQLGIFIKFIAIVVSEGGITSLTAETFSLLYTICEMYFNTDGIAEYALSIIAGVLHNCQIGKSLLRMQPKFGTLKTFFASFLSSRKVPVVLASLTNLILLFPSQIEPRIAIQTAINALGISDSFQLAPKLSSWIITELKEVYTLTSNDIWSILSTAISGGSKSYYLYQILANYSEVHQTIIDVISSMNCLFLIIKSLLESQESFVSIAGCTFLNTVFNYGEGIVFSNEVEEPFVQALKLAVSPTKFVETDKKEAALIILRFFIRSRDSTVYVIKILKSYQQKLFVDFQRQIESSNAFLAVQYFLFLYDASHFIEEWYHLLTKVVIDSQFPVLVIHVLNNSMNRQAIRDGLSAMMIIMDGIKDGSNPEYNVLTNTLIDGHIISNKVERANSGNDSIKIQQVSKELTTQVSELEVEKDCCIRELEALKTDAVKCSLDIEAEISMRPDYSEKKIKLQEQEAQMKEEIAAKKELLEDRIASNKVLKTEIEKLQRLTTTKSVREAGIRAKSSDINTINKDITDIEAQNAKIEQDLQNLIKGIETQKETEVKYLKFLKNGKSRIRKQNAILKEVLEEESTERERNAQLRNDLSLAEQQISQLNDLIKEDQSQRKMDEQEIRRLKEEIEKIKRENEVNQYKAKLKLQSLDQLKEHMFELESKNNESKLLIKLLHKSTYSNMKIPENVSSLLNL